MDINKLYSDIKQAQSSDSVASNGFCQANSSTPTSPSQWSIDESDILHLDNHIFAVTTRHLDIILTVYLNPYQFQNIHRIPF